MKKLVLGLSALAIVACKQEPKIDYALLSGKLDQTQNKKLSIKGFNFEQNLTVTNEGSFSDTLRLPENGFYTLRLGRNKVDLYISKGDQLNISKDSLGFLFSGAAATKESNYLTNKTTTIKTLKGSIPEFYSLNETDYKAKVNAITDSLKATLNTFKDIDQGFLTAELQNLEYDSYDMLNNYERGHSHFNKKAGFKASEHFLPEAFKALTYNNIEAYKSSKSYQELAFSNVMNPIFEGLDNFNSVKPSDLSAISNLKIQDLKNKIVSYLSKMALSPENKNLEGLYTFLTKHTTDDKIKTDLTINFDKAKVLVKGKPSPTFSNYENHKGGTTSLEDLKGKYVYVDVWATWCGPCKAEIPSLKKVEKEYHSKNIAFVSASIDVKNAHKKWVDMVNKEELGGIQLIADKNWKSQFVLDYGINGIPRFILIDPAGNIVSAEAPRPSDPKLKQLFDSLEM